MTRLGLHDFGVRSRGGFSSAGMGFYCGGYLVLFFQYRSSKTQFSGYHRRPGSRKPRVYLRLSAPIVDYEILVLDD